MGKQSAGNRRKRKCTKRNGRHGGSFLSRAQDHEGKATSAMLVAGQIEELRGGIVVPPEPVLTATRALRQFPRLRHYPSALASEQHGRWVLAADSPPAAVGSRSLTGSLSLSPPQGKCCSGPDGSGGAEMSVGDGMMGRSLLFAN
jgi:hypothetical protein